MIVVLLALGLVFGQGCVNWNSHNGGNVAANVKPLPYVTGEQAVTTTTTKHVASDGKVTTDIVETAKSGLEVNSEIQHDRLDVAKKVPAKQVTTSQSQGGGFLNWLMTPTPVVVVRGGYGMPAPGFYVPRPVCVTPAPCNGGWRRR